jgi:outer membrane receptor protein involved in Fe transport
MKHSLLALSLAVALATVPGSPAEAAPSAVASPAAAAANGNDEGGGTPHQHRRKAQDLEGVSVTARLDQARNALSPDTGSSQYVIDQKAITQLPLGAATPMNQVLLQAPGVVQDSYGGLHVRGDHANLQYRIDGVIIPESIAGFGQTLDARTIQVVKLLDGALPAQYGERTAAVVDITTRSGHALGNGGSVGVSTGSNGMLNPNASIWGDSGRWSYFLTANYMENDAGIENPTASKKPVHDHTNQVKAFGNLSYLINDDTRLSLLFGISNNRFQIPDRPGQTPAFGYLDTVAFNSADLNERQHEQTRFGVLALQGRLGSTDYQVSLGQRYSGLQYIPDDVGDLMFNGVAAATRQADRASTLQADFSMPLGDSHTLRYGLYGDFEQAATHVNSLVFPANPDGSQASTVPFTVFTGDHITARTWAAYVQDEWSIGENWTVNYGLRGDRYQAFGGSESQLSPRLGVVWQATPGTTVHAGYSRYFTPPAAEMISATDIASFAHTTNAVKNYGNNQPLAERSDYLDLGVSQNVGTNLTLGLDGYLRRVERLQDEGQFGQALVYSTFNYAHGRIAGVEFSASYDQGPFSSYFNFAYNHAEGERVITSQYNFSPEDLAYIHNHFIHLDHDQKYTSSGGVTYALGDTTRVGANYLFGSGLRRDGLVPNGDTMPAYFQLDLSISHDFDLAPFGKLHTQLALINALDRSYQLRDGTGIGVGAPQFGPRRGLYLSLQKEF